MAVEKMKKWRVWFGESYVVEAMTKDEALEKGQTMFEASTTIEGDADFIN